MARRSPWLQLLSRLALALAMLAPLFGAVPPAAEAAPPAVAAGSQRMTDRRVSGWTVGGGTFFSWECYDPLDNGVLTGFLRRQPTGGGPASSISTSAFCGTAVAADTSGLYYWLDGKLVKRAAGQMGTPVELAAATQPIGKLVLSENYIYWIGANGAINRLNKSGGSVRELVSAAAAGSSPAHLTLTPDALFWFGGAGLRSASRSCDLACAVSTRANERGNSLIFQGTNLYWNSDTRIRTLLASCQACTPITVYDRPAGSSYLLRGDLGSDGTSLFWVENIEDCSGLICVPTANGRLRVRSLGSNDPRTLDQPVVGYGEGLMADTWGAYYEVLDTGNNITYVYRLPASASAISFDLRVAGWEVTQGIQNLSNTVTLVANKATYVRVYGGQVSGPAAPWVHVVVEGKRNGVALPGSPLQPLNGDRGLEVGQGFNRANLDDGWLFKLPKSWTSGGDISLRAVVDPGKVYDDPALANNTLTDTFTFRRKAPVCAIFMPVRTQGSSASTESPNFWPMVERFKTLWPVADVWTYEQSEDIAELEARFGIPPWEYGPYEIPADNSWVIASIITRDTLTDDPDECAAANARVHYMGMISADTNTMNPEGGNNTGFANFISAATWVKLPPDGESGEARTWDSPDAGSVMAQEFSHNYNGILNNALINNRWGHVDCGDPDGVNTSYPYSPCTLDDRPLSAFSTHYGFDPLTLTPIAPNTASDYMSYGSSNWVSDYTWHGMISELEDAPAAGALAPEPAAGALANADKVIFITGVLTEAQHLGSINHGWTFPSAELSANVLSKMERLAAPASLGLDTIDGYSLRLIGANNAVLDERAVAVNPGSQHDHDLSVFAITFPAPAGAVTRIELLHDGVRVDELAVGASAPTVSLVSPTAGASVSDKLVVTWQAADADAGDRMLATIQYSPDMGASWRTLATGLAVWAANTPTTVTLDNLDGLPGSAGKALVRVAVSDGLHTGLAVSQPFTVAERAPSAYIAAPADGASFAAGQPIAVSGGANDAEDGGLDDAALTWQLDGAVIGSGSSLALADVAPGAHSLTLTARDSTGKERTSTVAFSVAPLAVPQAAAPAHDGVCADAPYSGAAAVELAPYADGARASARLTRSGDRLWVCVSGLDRQGAGSPGAALRLHLDADASRDAAAQSGDLLLELTESGGLTLLRGNGGGGYEPTNGEGVAAVVSAGANSWSAELRVNASLLGGWGHLAGVGLAHRAVQSVGDSYAWPAGLAAAEPRTWGLASLAALPAPETLSPAGAPAGGPGLTLTVGGSGFAEGAQVYWNGAARPTTRVSDSQLTATISAADLASAAAAKVTVRVPGLEAAALAALTFEVRNPTPAVSSAALSGGTLTVRGSNFAPGATVVWDGLTYQATRVSAGELRATIVGEDVVQGTEVSVAVVNPGPGGGISNLVAVRLAAGSRLYLPLLSR